jgi:signal transduction histidine kinase
MLPLVAISAATLGVYATLLLRWRAPVAVFVLQWSFTLASLLLPDFRPFAGLLVALHAMARRQPASWSGPALASTVVPFSLYSAQAAGMGPGGSTAAFTRMLLLWLLLAGGAWGIGRLAYVSAERSRRFDDLIAAKAADAARTERMHLARELHDIVAHTVTIMVVQASGAKAVLDPAQSTVRHALEVIEDSGVQAMSELHRMLTLLRSEDPTPESALAPAPPVVADIADLVGDARRAGASVSLMEDGSPGSLDPSVGTAAYRVVQESITNAVKHAGASPEVTVRLSWSAMELAVQVTDRQDGSSRPSELLPRLSSGHGLAGLRDRVTMVGGTFTCGPTANGFSVIARLPRQGVLTAPAASAGSSQ